MIILCVRASSLVLLEELVNRILKTNEKGTVFVLQNKVGKFFAKYIPRTDNNHSLEANQPHTFNKSAEWLSRVVQRRKMPIYQYIYLACL